MSAIELSQTIRAPRDLLWKTCTSAEGLARWQADSAEGETRVGSKLTLHWSVFNASVELEITELVPRERIVFQGADSQVEFTLRDDGVVLRHSGVEAEEDAEGLTSSWRIALAQLAHCAERHPGRTRRIEWLVRETATSAEAAYLFFTDPHCLGLWLAQTGGIGATGEAYDLGLAGSLRLSGRVLANVPGRDVAISCDEQGEALLSLRTLPSPRPSRTGAPNRLIALTWSEWGPPRSDSAQLLRHLSDAADRLSHRLESGGNA